MADATLAAIRKKVRRLTRTPSADQMSDVELDEYINTFIQYDFPGHLKVFSQRRTLTFYTDPNIDVYTTNTVDNTDPLYNFKNKVKSVYEPVYVGGFKSNYSQSSYLFFNSYPFINTLVQVGTGDGVVQNFNGTLSSKPILRNKVLFSSIDAAGNGLRLSDNGTGSFVGDIGIGPNAIDYVTGVYSITFNVAPDVAKKIYAHTVPYIANRPTSILYFDNTFTLRPVPDKVYPVTIEVDYRPTELANIGDFPELEQWWQYIAYGASKKIFEERMDTDSVQQIMPEFQQQELLVLRRTIIQQSNQRVATIYTNNTSGGSFFGDSYY